MMCFQSLYHVGHVISIISLLLVNDLCTPGLIDYWLILGERPPVHVVGERRIIWMTSSSLGGIDYMLWVCTTRASSSRILSKVVVVGVQENTKGNA